MKTFFTTIFTLLTLLMVASCGDEEGFVIKCYIEGLDTRGLEMTYMTRKGLSRSSFHPVDGKVELRGVSPQPTLAEVFTLDGNLLFSCVAKDGDNIKLKMKLGDPSTLSVTGNDANRDYSAFIAKHDSILTHGSDSIVNRLIARRVRENPGSMASTLLMVTKFRTRGYELMADSLLSEIASEARPALLSGSYAATVGEQVTTSARGPVKSFTMRMGVDTLGHDTIIRYVPPRHSYTLLIFNDSHKTDSITRCLRELRKSNTERRLMMIELSLTPDSTLWRETIKGDSVNWYQAWAPGSAAAREIRRLSIPTTPYYIVSDSSGTQLYRGSSLAKADEILKEKLQ